MEIVKNEYVTPVIDFLEITDILTASPDDINPGDTDLPPIDW